MVYKKHIHPLDCARVMGHIARNYVIFETLTEDAAMPISVGQDTAKTRKTISVGDQSIAYYSIPAATEAGLGDFSNLPAALKVVLENMLRLTSRHLPSGAPRAVRTRARLPIALPAF
jgi:hypothetical protein